MIIGQGRLDTETAGYEGERKKNDRNQSKAISNKQTIKEDCCLRLKEANCPL